MITYITKKEMIERTGSNYFGFTFWDERNILIRKDIIKNKTLNKWLMKSLLGHEQNHAKRGDRGGFIYNEPPAWWSGFKAHPIGFLLSIIMSLFSLERWKLYLGY